MDKKVTLQVFEDLLESDIKYKLILKEKNVKSEVAFEVNFKLLDSNKEQTVNGYFRIETLLLQLSNSYNMPQSFELSVLNKNYQVYFNNLILSSISNVPESHDLSVIIKEVDVSKLNLLNENQALNLLHNLCIEQNKDCFMQVIGNSVFTKAVFDSFTSENKKTPEIDLQEEINQLFRTACSYNNLEIVKFLKESDSVMIKPDEKGILHGQEWAEIKENKEILAYLNGNSKKAKP